MLVLVEDAPEAVSSSYVEVSHPFWIGDLRGSGHSGRALAVPWCRAVSVVELFELAEGVQPVLLVTNQGPVEQFATAGLHPPLHD
jgi:hypothetical protein